MKFVPQLTSTELAASPLAKSFSNFKALVHGEGGQGVVFAADASLKNSRGVSGVALKIYYPGAVSERTQREVEAMHRIQCDNLVRLHSAGDIKLRGTDCIFVATEFLAGQLLSSKISAGKLPLNEVAKLACNVACAIEAMWNERIVHRDIKPENIMVVTSGDSVVLDLGVARHLSMGSLTSVGKTWGTQGYMSPEQCQGLRQLSCKSDIFALGIVLHEALLGYHPTNKNQMLLLRGGPSIRAHLNNDPVAAFLDSMVILQPSRRPTPAQVAAYFKQHST